MFPDITIAFTRRCTLNWLMSSEFVKTPLHTQTTINHERVNISFNLDERPILLKEWRFYVAHYSLFIVDFLVQNSNSFTKYLTKLNRHKSLCALYEQCFI